MQHLTPGIETIHDAVHRTWPDAFTASVNEPCDVGATYSTFDFFRRGEVPPIPRDPFGLPHTTERFVRPSKDYSWSSVVDHMGTDQAVNVLGGHYRDVDYPAPRFMWCNFTLTDAAMHEGGPYSEMAAASVRDSDGRLGEILAAVERAGFFDDCAFALVAARSGNDRRRRLGLLRDGPSATGGATHSTSACPARCRGRKLLASRWASICRRASRWSGLWRNAANDSALASHSSRRRQDLRTCFEPELAGPGTVMIFTDADPGACRARRQGVSRCGTLRPTSASLPAATPQVTSRLRDLRRRGVIRRHRRRRQFDETIRCGPSASLKPRRPDRQAIAGGGARRRARSPSTNHILLIPVIGVDDDERAGSQSRLRRRRPRRHHPPTSATMGTTGTTTAGRPWGRPLRLHQQVSVHGVSVAPV
jgi:hypothetical protein